MGYGFGANIEKEMARSKGKKNLELFTSLMIEMQTSLLEAADSSNKGDWARVRAKMLVLNNLSEELFNGIKRETIFK